jgi:hypothetical protein
VEGLTVGVGADGPGAELGGTDVRPADVLGDELDDEELVFVVAPPHASRRSASVPVASVSEPERRAISSSERPSGRSRQRRTAHLVMVIS